MQQLNITSVVAQYARAAELENPIKDGDWRDSNGLLHCGKCGAYLECRIRESVFKRPPNMTVDEERHRNEVIKYFTSRTFRCVCNCKEKERREHELRQFNALVKENRYHCFGKTPNLMNCVFDIDDARESRASYISRRYAEGFITNVRGKGQKLLYWGDVGHGKTYYACCVANAVISLGCTVKFTSITKIIAQAAQYTIPLQSVIEGLLEHDLVILDDFGTEEISDKHLKRTLQIINELNEHNTAVIITTNLSPERLDTPANDDEKRIFSRIMDKCTKVQVKVDGDRRRSNGTRT